MTLTNSERNDRSVDNGRSIINRWVIPNLPDVVKRPLVQPYNRIQTIRADRSFRRCPSLTVSPRPNAPRHVLCVVIDALRADALHPEVSPFLEDRYQSKAITPAPWTFPAVTSLLTGRYPHEHGAMRRSDRAERDSTDLVIPPTLSTDAPTVVDAYVAAGYDTYGAFAFHMPFFALAGRFEQHALYDNANAETVITDYLNWLTNQTRERTFAYLHLADLHEPVNPPEQYWQSFRVDKNIPEIQRWKYVDGTESGESVDHYRRHRRRLYSAALSYVDDQLAALTDAVTDHVGTDRIIIVTGDHGEAFWEHVEFDARRFVDSRPAYSVDHGGTPYESIARVPIVTDGFDLAITDDSMNPPSLIDITPTLLDLLGATTVFNTSGYSLLQETPTERVVLIEATRYGYERKAAYADGWKLLVSQRDGVSIGFRLPDEEPVAVSQTVRKTLEQALPSWPDGTSRGRVVSKVAERRLTDLGYT